MKTLILSLIAILLSFCSCYDDSSKLEDAKILSLLAANPSIEVMVRNINTSYRVSNQEHYYGGMSRFSVRNTGFTSYYFRVQTSSQTYNILLNPGDLKIFDITYISKTCTGCSGYYPVHIHIYNEFYIPGVRFDIGSLLLDFTCHYEK